MKVYVVLYDLEEYGQKWLTYEAVFKTEEDAVGYIMDSYAPYEQADYIIREEVLE